MIRHPLIRLSVLGALLLVGAGCFGAADERIAVPPLAPPVECPVESKQCPDGSTISRVPPACDFAACPEPSSPPPPWPGDCSPRFSCSGGETCPVGTFCSGIPAFGCYPDGCPAPK